MDKTSSDRPLEPRSDFDTGFFRLDHAREEFVRQIGDMPLNVAQSRWVLHALAMYDYSELESIASLIERIRADGPL